MCIFIILPKYTQITSLKTFIKHTLKFGKIIIKSASLTKNIGKQLFIIALVTTALWSLQIVGRGLHQEISRNLKGIRDSANPKRFYSPFLQNQFCI